MHQLRFFTLFVFVLFFSFAALSQSNEKPEAKEPAVVNQPFDISHISEAVEYTDKLIRKARELANDSAGESKLNLQLNELISRYNPDELDSLELDYSELNLWALKDKKSYWDDIKKQLTEQSEGIKSYVDEVRKNLDTIGFLNSKWVITKSVADTVKDVKSTSEIVISSLEKCDAVIERLKEKTARILELENRTSQQILSVNGVLAHIASLTEERGKNLFSRDSKPFFIAFREQSANDQGIVGATYSSVKIAVDEVGIFIKENRSSIFYHILFSLLLYLLMKFVNSKFKQSELYEEEDFFVARKLLGQPFLTTLLLALLTSSLFYGRVPVLVRDVLIVIAIVPVSILLPKILNVRMRFFVFFLILLVFLDKIQGLLLSGSINQRTIILVISIISIVGFGYMLRTNSNLNKAIRASNNGFFLLLIKLFLILVIGSVIANLIGAFGLARLTTSGIVHSFSLGIIVFLAASILKVVLLFVIRSGFAGNINVIKKYHQETKKWTFLIITLWGFWLWFKASLNGFAILSFAEAQLDNFIQTSWQFGEINLSVNNIIDFIFILALFVLIANVINLLLREEILNRFDMRKGITLAISILSRYVILLLGFILAMSSAGISLSKLSILIGALGVGIGFGLQNIVSNFVSGLVIIFERPIHIGDIVSTNMIEGEVIDIGLRSSRIRTWEGAEVIVPNNNLIANDVTNWTFSDKKRRKEIIILVEDGPSPRDVKAVIDNVVQSHDGLLKEPIPQAYFLGYENKALKFRLLLWLSENLLQTPSEVLLNLHDALSANGFKPYIPVQRVLLSNDVKQGQFTSIIGEIDETEQEYEQGKNGGSK